MRRHKGGPKGGAKKTIMVNKSKLLRDISSCENKCSNLDEIIDHLRSTSSEYRRIKLLPFTKHVQQIIAKSSQNRQESSKPSPSQTSEVDESETLDILSPSRKRHKKHDESELRLLRVESQHVKRRSMSMPVPVSETSSDSTSSDEDEAVYGERVEPEFDLTKSMLRSAYAKRLLKLNDSEGKSDEVVGERVKLKAGQFELKENEEKSDDDDAAFGEKAKLISNGSKSKDNDENSDVRVPKIKLKLVKNRKIEASGGLDDAEAAVKAEGPKFKDIGGIGKVLEELKMEVIFPLYHPELPRWLGVMPIAGVLLHGPPGCGKTKLANAIANETGVPFYKMSATELVSGVSGASEENIRQLFSKAYRTAPSIVFIDEIDAIASKRENSNKDMERRIVTQLMTCMDDSQRLVQPANVNVDSEVSDSKPGYVLVIGATNRPDAVDPALRRPGRFDREIALGVPDEKARVEILSVLTRNLRLEGAFDLVKIAKSTPGFVGADLTALVNKAGNLSMKRIIDTRKVELSGESENEEHNEEWLRQPWLPEEMEKLSIAMVDFEEAVELVQPSSRREGFSTIPNVRWEDVGGLDLIRLEFDRHIVRRIKYPECYEALGMDLESGFLLYGPPGCGKTLIAKAVANEAGANFIHIKGPELLSKYVGESESAVRTIFGRARTCSPCVLFFDEVDALTTKRGKEGGWVVERLLNQLLVELDGAEQRRGVYVIGATNRPEVMDRALLRPGRLGKMLYVPLPTPEERGLILKALSRKKPIDPTVDLNGIGQSDACKDLSGADLSALMNEAAMAALEDAQIVAQDSSSNTPLTIKMVHFEQALGKVSPSVSKKQKRYYQSLSENLKAA